MLIQRGEDRSHRLDRRLAFTLAVVAGSLNAAAFHAVGFFSANMTGNVSSLSSLLALGQWQHGLGYLMILLTFILGATVSTLAIDTGLRQGVIAIYARVVLAEAGLLLALCMARQFLQTPFETALLIIGLSFLMGLQNAIVTHISNARIRTTHVSGMSTDIGIGLARLILPSTRTPLAHQRQAVRSRLYLHLGTIFFFLIGGIMGVMAYRRVGDLSFAMSALPLIAVAIPTLLRARRHILN